MRSGLMCLVFLACISLLGSLAQAQVATWDGSVDSDWFDADNWESQIEPIAGRITLISSAGASPDISGSSSDAFSGQIFIGYNSQVPVDINNGGTLTTTQSDASPSYLGWNALGQLTVSGSGSRWDITGVTSSSSDAIRLGYEDTSISRGRLIIENQGHVSISNGAGIRMYSWEDEFNNVTRSQISINGTSDTAGTLDAGWIEGDASSTADSRISFDHIGSNYYFTDNGLSNGDAVDIRGAIEVYQSGGTTYLTGNNTYTGGTHIFDGTLAVGSNANLGDSSSAITFEGSATSATLRATASFANDHAIDLSDNAGTIQVDTGELLSQNAAITGTEALTKTGAGAFDLNVDSAGFTGTLTVQAGTFIQDGALGASAIYVNEGTLYSNHQSAISGFKDIPYDFTGAGEIRFDRSVALTGDNSGFTGTFRTSHNSQLGDGTSNWGPWAVDIELAGGQFQNVRFAQVGEFEITGDVSGTGGLLLTDGTVLRLSGNNTYTGNTTLAGDGAELIISGNMGATEVQSSLGVGETATITIDNDSEITIQSNLTAFGSTLISKIGTGTATLTGDNSILDFVISEGTIQVGDGGDLGGNTVTNNSALVFNQTSAHTADEAIGGTGTLTKNNSNTLTLTGANSYSGTTTISGGTLQIGDGSSAAGTLGSGDVSIASGASLAFDHDLSGGTHTVANDISGAGGVSIAGLGTYDLTGSNSYSGSTTIGSNSTLQINNIGSGDIINDGQLNLAPASSMTLNNTLSGSGNIYIAASKTVTRSTNSSLMGDVFIGDGATLQLGNGGATGSLNSGSIFLNDNATLVINRSDSFTFGNDLIDNGSGQVVSIDGSGIITFGSNGFDDDYTLDFTVNDGTLRFTGDVGYVRRVTIKDGGTLEAKPYDYIGTVTVENGGILSPGNSPGTLNVDNLFLNDSSVLIFELADPMVIGGGTNDLIDVSFGDFVLDGLVNIVALEGFSVGEYTLITTSDLNSFTDNGIALGDVPSGFAGSVYWDSESGSVLLNVTAVPEPGVYALVLGCVTCLVLFWRKRRA